MGMPSIDISFKNKATAAVARSQKGVVALIVKDGSAADVLTLTSAAQIPASLGKANQEYIARAFMGYVNPPRKVIVYVLPSAAENITEALEYLATQVFDYLAITPDATEAECTAVVSWIKGRRLNDKAICKAVLPHTAADSEAIVNFATDGIKAGTAVFTAGQYASRVAGLIAGTPMTISCTYAPLTEVSDVERMTREEMDAAVDKGEFILFHDGEKVKVGRGVNSLKTTTAEKSESFKSIKIVETMDMVDADIRMTIQDSYIGKYANSYDNKLLLCTAVKSYLVDLEVGGLLQKDYSAVSIDVEKQEAYLKGQGVDTSKMTEQEVKEADTGTHVFLTGKFRPLNAIEDVEVNFEV